MSFKMLLKNTCLRFFWIEFRCYELIWPLQNEIINIIGEIIDKQSN